VIRVLEVLASLQRAGAERVAVSLACGLGRPEFETEVVSLYDAAPGGFEPVLEASGIPVWHLGKRRGLDPRMWTRLRQVIRRFRPAIIHTHSYVLRYVLPAAGEARTVHTVHNLADREVDLLGRAIHRVAFRWGTLPVALGPEMARSFRAVYGREPAAVIPNGIDAARCHVPESREAWRRAHGFNSDDVLIVSVARLAQQKNPLALIDAFAAGPAHAVRCHLLLAGAGPLLEAARARAAAQGIAGRVHFLGVVSAIPELLSACDVFTLASDWEGSPVAVLEAMAARLPVVATAVGGVPDLVEVGRTGLLIPPGDVQALGAALASLVDDRARRSQFGEAGAARAASFDQSVMVASYAALFRSAL
jgi:glycosyltransferase involved in cell wall biosynthesis